MKKIIKGIKEIAKVFISIYIVGLFNIVSFFNIILKLNFVSSEEEFAICLALYMYLIELLFEFVIEKISSCISSCKCNLDITFYSKGTMPEITSTPNILVNELGLSEINMLVSFNGSMEIIKKTKVMIPQNSFFTIQSNGEIAYIDDDGNYILEMSKLVQGSQNIRKEFLISFAKDTFENLGGEIEIRPELIYNRAIDKYFINLKNNKFKITLQ